MTESGGDIFVLMLIGIIISVGLNITLAHICDYNPSCILPGGMSGPPRAFRGPRAAFPCARAPAPGGLFCGFLGEGRGRRDESRISPPPTPTGSQEDRKPVAIVAVPYDPKMCAQIALFLALPGGNGYSRVHVCLGMRKHIFVVKSMLFS